MALEVKRPWKQSGLGVFASPLSWVKGYAFVSGIVKRKVIGWLHCTCALKTKFVKFFNFLLIFIFII